MKIRIKIDLVKLQMHEHVHKNVNENMFSFTFLCIFSQVFVRYATFALLISYMVFNPFKMAVQFFWTASSFPNFDGPNAFFPKFNRPLAPTSKR